jgi:hypothetical protein
MTLKRKEEAAAIIVRPLWTEARDCGGKPPKAAKMGDWSKMARWDALFQSAPRRQAKPCALPAQNAERRKKKQGKIPSGCPTCGRPICAARLVCLEHNRKMCRNFEENEKICKAIEKKNERRACRRARRAV